MVERWSEAYEAWAAEHPWVAAALGVVTLTAPAVVALLIAGRSPGFSLLLGGALAATAVVVLGVASLMTGRPVIFAILGADRGPRPPTDRGLTVPNADGDGGGWGGDGGGWGGDGGGDGGGGGGS